MAIDIFCYSSREPDIVDRLILELETKAPSYFSSNFLVGPIKKATEIHQEIADEKGLKNARSLFLIRVNNKERLSEVADIANMIRASLGATEVLLLVENEREI